MSAAGPRFRRLAVDVKSRGVCLALIQQLACPVVRVRRLDVRAAQLGAVEKVQLFEAIARMRSKAAALVRSGSALSLTDMAKQFGAEGLQGPRRRARGRGRHPPPPRARRAASTGTTPQRSRTPSRRVTAGTRGTHRADPRPRSGGSGLAGRASTMSGASMMSVARRRSTSTSGIIRRWDAGRSVHRRARGGGIDRYVEPGELRGGRTGSDGDC